MRFIILCLTLCFLTIGCCASPVKIDTPVKKYATLKQLQKAVDDQAAEKTTGPVYVVFSASWCPTCAELKKLLGQGQAEILDRVLFVNVDETWAFLLSRDVGVEGVPTLVTFDMGTPSKPRFGMSNILVYLIANIEN